MITIEQIKTTISDNVPDVNLDEISLDAKLRDEEIDSLDFFNIVIDCQAITGFEVPDEDIEKLDTINNILKYFQDK